MQANHGRFAELNVQVLGISVDSIFAHQAFAEQLGGLDFPLLADFHPKAAVIHAYGLWNESWGVSQRAIVIVDEEGIVRYSEVIRRGPPDVEPMLAALGEMQ